MCGPRSVETVAVGHPLLKFCGPNGWSWCFHIGHFVFSLKLLIFQIQAGVTPGTKVAGKLNVPELMLVPYVPSEGSSM